MKIFKKGDRIKMTIVGQRQFKSSPDILKSQTGVVYRKSHTFDMITVLRDGYKTAERYHIDFWRKDKSK